MLSLTHSTCGPSRVIGCPAEADSFAALSGPELVRFVGLESRGTTQGGGQICRSTFEPVDSASRLFDHLTGGITRACNLVLVPFIRTSKFLPFFPTPYLTHAGALRHSCFSKERLCYKSASKEQNGKPRLRRRHHWCRHFRNQFCLQTQGAQPRPHVLYCRSAQRDWWHMESV